jgi:hypothetical protein
MKKQIYLMVVAVCLGLLTKAQTVIPSYVPTNGLVGWWPFNGNANDLSINANNGTVNGATLTTDRYGNANKAYNFNGINNYIGLANINFTNSISIGFWINIPLNGGGSAIVQNLPSPPYNTSFQVSTNTVGNQYILYSNSCNLSQNFNINQSITIASNWHYLQYTIDVNSVCKLYFDGVYQGVFNGTNFTNCSNSNTSLRFGGMWVVNDPQWFNGTIDDIGIWNRALTPCEVKKLYTSGSFSVSSSSSNTICVGQSLNLTAAGATTYTWSTGATSQSISVSPTVSTVYTVSTTYSAGCTDSRTFNVTVNACTGLNEAELVINSVRIFPNPAKEQLSIMVNNNAVMGKKYSITNTLGQEVASGIFTKQTTELNIQQLSAGIYQLNIEGLNENYKFIKE